MHKLIVAKAVTSETSFTEETTEAAIQNPS